MHTHSHTHYLQNYTITVKFMLYPGRGSFSAPIYFDMSSLQNPFAKHYNNDIINLALVSFCTITIIHRTFADTAWSATNYCVGNDDRPQCWGNAVIFRAIAHCFELKIGAIPRLKWGLKKLFLYLSILITGLIVKA